MMFELRTISMYKIIVNYAPSQTDNHVVNTGLFAEHCPFDSVIDISITNLPVHTHVILSAELKDEKGKPWFHSEAVFEANGGSVYEPPKMGVLI